MVRVHTLTPKKRRVGMHFYVAGQPDCIPKLPIQPLRVCTPAVFKTFHAFIRYNLHTLTPILGHEGMHPNIYWKIEGPCCRFSSQKSAQTEISPTWSPQIKIYVGNKWIFTLKIPNTDARSWHLCWGWIYRSIAYLVQISVNSGHEEKKLNTSSRDPPLLRRSNQ